MTEKMKDQANPKGTVELVEEELDAVQGATDEKAAAFILGGGSGVANGPTGSTKPPPSPLPPVKPVWGMEKARHDPLMATVRNIY